MHKIKPLRTAKKPRYPLQAAALVNPQWLQRLPLRWQKSRTVVMAASMAASLALALSACAQTPPQDTQASCTVSPPPSSEDVPLGGVPLPTETINEQDAFKNIEKLAGSLYSSSRQQVVLDAPGKEAVCLRYDIHRKALEEAVFADTKNPMAIDLYSDEKKIGFEYLDEERETDEPADYTLKEAPAHADRQKAYVLVMDRAVKTDDVVNSEIKEQVENFLAWLKAEGII